jgi:hypothetical protein
MPGDEEFHQIYPGNVRVETFDAWEAGQREGAKRAQADAGAGKLPQPQHTNLPDPAPWDANAAKKSCGKRTRYLTIRVTAKSGCANSGKTWRVEATTYGHEDSTTSPTEPTQTVGAEID